MRMFKWISLIQTKQNKKEGNAVKSQSFFQRSPTRVLYTFKLKKNKMICTEELKDTLFFISKARPAVVWLL